MNKDALYLQFEQGFKKRKFSAGLLVALIDFFIDLDTPNGKFKDFAAFLAKYPAQAQTAGKDTANTLIVKVSASATKGIRPFYNKVETYFRAEQKRFDYPSCAPHATQAVWDYQGWLDSLVTYSKDDLLALRKKVVDYVLKQLPSHEFDPAQVPTEPPLFKLILESFDMAAKSGEKSGAAYQGICYGFVRADNPHLNVEIEKVRTGSKRLQRVGDVDCWDGERLAISGEVKQYEVVDDKAADFEAFANAVGVRGAIGIVFALSFGEGAKDTLEGMGLRALDKEDVLRTVELWDTRKQAAAVQATIYYAKHIEKNSSLTERLTKFIEEAEADFKKKIVEALAPTEDETDKKIAEAKAKATKAPKGMKTKPANMDKG